MPQHSAALASLALHIADRRKAIMAAWRALVTRDPRLTTGASLPRAQLHDHIPALLEDFEDRLADRGDRALAKGGQKADAAAHGLHRWQQGFDLGEVTRELGRLNECVVIELEAYAVAHPELDPGVMAEARRIWAEQHGVAVSASTSQYFKLRQLESASHVSELETALQSLQELEARRAELWQQAAHDLRGNLGVVVNATAGLAAAQASAETRNTFIGLLERNVRSLQRLLEDVTSLARLQGGQEHRQLASLDAAPLLREVCDGLQPLASERQLELRCDGPTPFVVEGDEIKIRRIVQNLVLNALKYTHEGGVSASWGMAETGDGRRWLIEIRDTGPGIHAGPGSRIAQALEAATDHARDIAADAATGDVTHVAPGSPSGGAEPHLARQDSRPVRQQPGEGLGLSIVKRLCELLDATMELDSKIDQGTTVRILLPRSYDEVQPPPGVSGAPPRA